MALQSKKAQPQPWQFNLNSMFNRPFQLETRELSQEKSYRSPLSSNWKCIIRSRGGDFAGAYPAQCCCQFYRQNSGSVPYLVPKLFFFPWLFAFSQEKLLKARENEPSGTSFSLHTVQVQSKKHKKFNLTRTKFNFNSIQFRPFIPALPVVP